MRIGMIGIMAAVMAVGLLSGIVAAEDTGDADGAAPLIVMSATPSFITVENWGTAPANVGGLRIITKNGNVGTDVAKMPYCVQLRPEPFPTKGAQNNDYKIVLPVIGNITSGETVYLTNGVGNYATAIVA